MVGDLLLLLPFLLILLLLLLILFLLPPSSPRIGATFARTFLESRLPENSYFADTRLHLHVPEGATPKVRRE